MQDSTENSNEKNKNLSTNQFLNSKMPLNIPHNGDFRLYFANKINKLEAQRNAIDSTQLISSIFKKCVIYINGDTMPSKEELKRLILIHGGSCNAYDQTSTTHYVCNSFSSTKVKYLRKTKRFYVTVSWILESIKVLQKLPERHFLPKEFKINEGGDITKLMGGTYTDMIMEIVDNLDDVGEQEVKGKGMLVEEKEEEENMNNDVIGRHVEYQGYSYDVAGEEVEVEQVIVAEPTFLAAAPQDDVPSNSNIQLTTKRSPNKRGMSSEENPNFLQDFFANSRLHFIGTWRNRLPRFTKQMMGIYNKKYDMTSSSSSSSSSKRHRSADVDSSYGNGNSDSCSHRVILHVDMDCFFVSAVLRTKTHLIDKKPVVVAHGYSDGCEISSCNYPARAKGIKNGMFMKQAKICCPQLIVIDYDFQAYQAISEQIYNIFYSIPEAVIVEPVSVDEAYIEFPPNINGVKMAEYIRAKILRETQCPCSAGIGPNMLLAKMATKRAKPNGVFEINAANFQSVVGNLAVRELPGIGSKTSKVLSDHGLHLVSDITCTPKDTLQSIAGSSIGTFLHNASCGIDETPLTAIPTRQSVSIDVAWGLRFSDISRAIHFIGQLAEECSSRLKDAAVRGARHFTVKVLVREKNAPMEPPKFLGCGHCDEFNKSQTVSKALISASDIEKVAISLFKQLIEGVDLLDLRGVGLKATKLEEELLQLQESSRSWFQPAPDMIPRNIPLSSSTTAGKVGENGTECIASSIGVPSSCVWQRDVQSDEDDKDDGDVQMVSASSRRNYPTNQVLAGKASSSTADQNGLSDSQLEFLSSLPPELVEEQVKLLRSLNAAPTGPSGPPNKISPAYKRGEKRSRHGVEKSTAREGAKSLFEVVTGRGRGGKNVTSIVSHFGRPSSDTAQTTSSHPHHGSSAAAAEDSWSFLDGESSRSRNYSKSGKFDERTQSEGVDAAALPLRTTLTPHPPLILEHMSAKEFDLLLRDWLRQFKRQEGEVLAEEHISVLSNYGISLIQARQLDLAAAFIRSIRMRFSSVTSIGSSSSSPVTDAVDETEKWWNSCSAVIESAVQSEAIKLFHCKLSVK